MHRPSLPRCIAMVLAITCFPVGRIAFAEKAATRPVSLPALEPGPHLFIDDFLIREQSNLRRVARSPSRMPQPIVTGAEDGNFQPYVTVLRDPSVRRFYRM